ncbi:MAG: sigma-70 family RNA polymerase sigma factor [Blastocatellia bacterium]|nr:sigma-70 family RNA polymerase sigma factor [Blastocatellia bacterium]MBL8192306.1 sigma-70 family RNA polymerase sigma factor [Blastocatellia bacterium]MBN8722999.1 sigma-70 family RNA polymerase sigma factor [Acidobacteriota bacterium]
MSAPLPGEVTQLLKRWSDGDKTALESIMLVLYDDLRKLASRYLKNERKDHTLQPTALVHESFLRLVKEQDINWESRAHFLAVAAQIMRHILVDYARSRKADKHGGQMTRLVFDESFDKPAEEDFDLIKLDDALIYLAKLNPTHSQIVEMRFFGGMTIDEIATVVGVSSRTVDRSWLMAKTWLYQELTK